MYIYNIYIYIYINRSTEKILQKLQWTVPFIPKCGFLQNKHLYKKQTLV